MEKQQGFFDFAAEVGLTKHFGGLAATEALAELCHIGAGKVVLDVGCGAGLTPCFLAKRYDCRVVGVDIREAMVERSRERANRAGIAHRVEFRVADAQDLPFDDNLFDAVITESVTSFPEDKRKAVGEYARVTKPGGYVGLSESTWLKVPPPPEIIAWASQDLGASVECLTADGWVILMEDAGLSEIVAKTCQINVRNETRELFRRYGCGGMLGVWGRILVLYVKNPAYRRFVKEVRGGGIIPENLDEYFGYGMYVGRK